MPGGSPSKPGFCKRRKESKTSARGHGVSSHEKATHVKIHQQSDQQPESRKGMNSTQKKKNNSILTLLV